MNTMSRRCILQAFGFVPVALLTSGLSFAKPRPPSVGAVMRYLCDEVFPSPHQIATPL
ncbi:hypothetical protein QTN24_22160 [Cupriavidus sp. SZY C1]|uniref:hypothetical protein n=1 Tax=Cupriavidus sp. SZY C1 TaxID=3055037 RepID=UPI0028B3F720|nr:hypothetical protein [Cupriavidus sp. SZY C1]MDT6964217.1 hypothetical protein [Cupriavidus sp. SZY C1]